MSETKEGQREAYYSAFGEDEESKILEKNGGESRRNFDKRQVYATKAGREREN